MTTPAQNRAAVCQTCGAWYSGLEGEDPSLADIALHSCRPALLKEITTLRDQVAALTRERDEALMALKNWISRALDAERHTRGLEEALRDALIILDEPGTPPKSVWYAWRQRHHTALSVS